MPRTWQTPLVVILSAGLVFALSAGMRQTFGLFLIPMTEELGWGRGSFAFPIALMTLVMGVLAPVMGGIADKYGAGKVMLLGGVLWAFGLYGMSIAITPLMLTAVMGGVIGLGTASTSVAISFGAAGRMIPEAERSRALGMITAIGSFGQMLLLPVGQFFISWLGWRKALSSLALLMVGVIPSALGLSGSRGKEQEKGGEQSLSQALREAGHRGFLLLTAGFFICGIHVSFIQVHLPAYAVDQGLDPEIGAWALFLVGMFNILGAYTWGGWGGRYSKKRLLSTIYISRSVLFSVLLLVPKTNITVLGFSAVMGFLWFGTLPLTSGLVGQFFGVRYLSTLFGIVYASHQAGGFVGAWLGGLVYDATQSYDLMWYLSIALGLFSAGLHAPINEQPVERLVVVEEAG